MGRKLIGYANYQFLTPEVTLDPKCQQQIEKYFKEAQDIALLMKNCRREFCNFCKNNG